MGTITATGPDVIGFHAPEDEDFVFGGIMFGSTAGLLAFADGFGPNQQNSYSDAAGVEGVSPTRTGVAGASLNMPGVYGQVEDSPPVPAGLRAGVLGVASTQPGVIGFARDGDGVQGASFSATAVRAVSFFGPGVQSVSGAASGVTAISGTAGPTAPNFANVAGVVGSSDAQPGVLGTSKSFAGVFGFSSQGIGVTGQTLNPNSFAGFFAGNVIVNGTLTANVKNAVVTFPDRTQRVLHCMESPEHWFEDFGVARLKSGRAVVSLDADFAKVIKLGDYRVFLTAEGDCRGLYVRSKSAGSFEVRELQGGESNVAFSYRIVGRRKDIKAHKRFARIDTHLPTPPVARAPRKSKPAAAAFRTFVAGLEQEAGKRAPKAARRVGRSRAPERWTPRAARRAAKQ